MINTALVLLLAYTLAGLSWRSWLATVVPEEAASPAIPSHFTDDHVHATGNLDAVAALHLFGKRQGVPTASVLPVIDAPETRLRLMLRGIVATSSAGQGLALIANGSAEDRLYKVGDTISAGVVLHEVLQDKVILNRQGRLETLTLPRESIDSFPVLPAVQKGEGKVSSGGLLRGAGGTIPQELKQMREEIANNPQKSFDIVRFEPVTDAGGIKGYRVTPGRQRRLFFGVGLRSGDVVTSVNGIALGDPSQMANLFSQLKSAEKFELELERAGRQNSLTIDVAQ